MKSLITATFVALASSVSAASAVEWPPVCISAGAAAREMMILRQDGATLPDAIQADYTPPSYAPDGMWETMLVNMARRAYESYHDASDDASVRMVLDFEADVMLSCLEAFYSPGE